MNHRYRCQYAGLANLCLKPLGHPSNMIFLNKPLNILFDLTTHKTEQREVAGSRITMP